VPDLFLPTSNQPVATSTRNEHEGVFDSGVDVTGQMITGDPSFLTNIDPYN